MDDVLAERATALAALIEKLMAAVQHEQERAKHYNKTRDPQYADKALDSALLAANAVADIIQRHPTT